MKIKIRCLKKYCLFISCVILVMSASSQDVKEESVVINVEVPVRVYQGNIFISHLTKNDFELYENGISQKIEAVYLVKKRAVERSEEERRFSPKTSRNYFLIFEITEYMTRLGEAVGYFYHNVLAPGDNLVIVTPLKTYQFNSEVLGFKSEGELVNELKYLLRLDAKKGSSEYTRLLVELEQLAQTIASQIDQTETIPTYSLKDENLLPLEKQLMKYSTLLRRVEKLRIVDQNKLLEFAKYLQDKEGQKYVFLFYQREFIPRLEHRILDQCMTLYQDKPNILRMISHLFEAYNREISFNVDLVKRAFADSSISIHFLFVSKPRRHISGVFMQEQSDDIFSAFRDMAEACGGFVGTSANPAYSFKQAVEASENYYLLYYSPKNYKKDNAFKRIEVKVKNKDYKVKHRIGYFAD